MSRGSFNPQKIFSELRWEIGKALFVKEFLNASIVFFSINIVLTLFNTTFWYSLAAATIFLTYRMIKGFKKSVVYQLEEGNPEVHEILRTAYDYQTQNSLMIQGMMYDLQKKLATVSTGVLIDPKRTLGKLTIIALLVFIPLLITSFAPFLIQENPLRDVNIAAWTEGGERLVLERLQGVELNDSVQYGDVNLIQLGDDELDVQLQSGGTILDFSEEGRVQNREFSSAETRGGVDATAAEYDANARSYDEAEIALINEYSCRQRGEC